IPRSRPHDEPGSATRFPERTTSLQHPSPLPQPVAESKSTPTAVLLEAMATELPASPVDPPTKPAETTRLPSKLRKESSRPSSSSQVRNSLAGPRGFAPTEPPAPATPFRLISKENRHARSLSAQPPPSRDGTRSQRAVSQPT